MSLFAVLLVAWLVAVPLGSSSLPWLASAVRNSALLPVVDRVLPEQAQGLSNALRDTVDTNGFPDVFGGLAPTRAREVSPPDPALAGSQVVVNGQRSVVKVLGTAPSCSRRIEGSGFVYADDRVMTNAHVVAGTRSLSVEVGGERHNGRVVVYDPRRDLAVIYVPGLSAPVMRFAARPAPSGADAIVLGYPQDGPYDAQSARVRDLGRITGPDIYESGNVTRDIYTIRALVRSGNSGGPLVAPNGQVLGVIFAAAADDPQHRLRALRRGGGTGRDGRRRQHPGDRHRQLHLTVGRPTRRAARGRTRRVGVAVSGGRSGTGAGRAGCSRRRSRPPSTPQPQRRPGSSRSV